MKNAWKVPGKASALNPPSFTSSEPIPPPPTPPDPPDPASPLSPIQFPPLSSVFSTGSKSFSSQKRETRTPTLPLTAAASTQQLLPSTGASPVAPANAKKPVIESRRKYFPRSENITVQSTVSGSQQENNNLDFKILEPKHSTPTQTNKASSLPAQLQLQASTENPPIPPTQTTIPPPQTTSPLVEPLSSTTHSLLPDPPSLVEKIRASENKTMRRLAPVTLAPSGRPRVLILDSVFQKGAEMHKDFIICYFNGKAPPFNQIQSVFNHMWGKGKRLEIHNNPLNRSAIVRIPSDYLRQKILEKNIWYVGDSIFHTSQWSSQHSASTPSLKAIRIWAHLIGVPLDLRHEEGLSLVAVLVGDPKETDDFTKNLVSLTVSHVKVEVDLTLPLPPVVEFERESGEVVEVNVHYPWVPPTCSHCHELGHIVRNCLTYTPPNDPPETQTKAQGKKTN